MDLVINKDGIELRVGDEIVIVSDKLGDRSLNTVTVGEVLTITGFSNDGKILYHNNSLALPVNSKIYKKNNMETDTQYYHIVDDKGRYYCFNDFNGKAAMMSPDNEGNPPSIAATMEKGQAERKINFLMKATKNRSNTAENEKIGYYFNDFSSLSLKEKI